jgi:hypothetical protein
MHLIKRTAGMFAMAFAVAGSGLVQQQFAAEAQGETTTMAEKIEMPTAPDFSSSTSRLAELRKHMRPYWSPGEAGGIVLLTGLDDENLHFFKALAARMPQLAQVVPGDERMVKLARILAEDVRAFMEAAKLAPGPYQLDNYHLDHARNGELTFNADGDPPIEIAEALGVSRMSVWRALNAAAG